VRRFSIAMTVLLAAWFATHAAAGEDRRGAPAAVDRDIALALEAVLLAMNDTPASKSPEPAKASSARTDAPPSVSAAPGHKAKAAVARRAAANNFNRLMKPPSQWNPAPPADGIHDPVISGTHLLQPPREAFQNFPKGNSGNRVDWVRALEEGYIKPRYDRLDPNKPAAVFDFNVVREVKGSMPDVVYPHKQHTQWLDCTNCHPAIFIPKKGANQMSMASILMGQQCGVCHGKVAFPISECRKCHSKDKPPEDGS